MSDDGEESSAGRQIPFGAGIKRKRIEFVPAREPSSEATSPRITSTSAGDRYLSIVFKNGALSQRPTAADTVASKKPSKSPSHQASDLKPTVCEVCNLPINNLDDAAFTTSTPHEASIAHMVCVKHSHPPSHLDRNRQGLKYLSSYGWDPDSRRGLGTAGEGIRAPIKAKAKHDTVGLGVDLGELKKMPEKKRVTLDAKKARKKYQEDRKKRERLQEMFYRNDEVEKYLGNG